MLETKWFEQISAVMASAKAPILDDMETAGKLAYLSECAKLRSNPVLKDLFRRVFDDAQSVIVLSAKDMNEVMSNRAILFALTELDDLIEKLGRAFDELTEQHPIPNPIIP